MNDVAAGHGAERRTADVDARNGDAIDLTALRPHRARGFSMIELMVGVVVGMIGLLVIYKTLSVWDLRTRTTVASGDAQVAGTLAMFNLERDIKLAGLGFGLAPSPVMGCTVTGSDSLTARTLSFPLYPIQIVQGTPPGAPDTINVLAGDSSYFVTSQTFTSSSAISKKLVRRDGFRRGDVAIVAGNATTLPGSANCQTVQISDNTDPDGFSVSHVNGNYIPDPTYNAASGVARYNAAAGTSTTFSSGTMFNLGPAPSLSQWQIDGRKLSRTEYLQGTPAFEISDGVINMKAEYGVDTNADNKVSDAEWTTATPVDWTQVRAVRVAILVRSSQFEKPETGSAGSTPVTGSAPTWGGGTPFLMTNVDGSTDKFGNADVDPNNWRYYRYRVYEKVIPLRNMIWGTAP